MEALKEKMAQMELMDTELALEKARHEQERKKLVAEREEMKREMMRQLKEKQELQDQKGAAQDGGSIAADRDCVICLDGEANCLFLNCGHIKCCMDCAQYVEECPMCRVKLEDRRQKYSFRL